MIRLQPVPSTTPPEVEEKFVLPPVEMADEDILAIDALLNDNYTEHADEAEEATEANEVVALNDIDPLGLSTEHFDDSNSNADDVVSLVEANRETVATETNGANDFYDDDSFKSATETNESNNEDRSIENSPIEQSNAIETDTAKSIAEVNDQPGPSSSLSNLGVNSSEPIWKTELNMTEDLKVQVTKIDDQNDLTMTYILGEKLRRLPNRTSSKATI